MKSMCTRSAFNSLMATKVKIYMENGIYGERNQSFFQFSSNQIFTLNHTLNAITIEVSNGKRKTAEIFDSN